MGALFDKLYGQVAPDKTESASYENLFPFEILHPLFSPFS
jgi:hypothetical protein